MEHGRSEDDEFVEPGVAVKRARFLEQSGDLQLRDSVQRGPEDGRSLANGDARTLVFARRALDKARHRTHRLVAGGIDVGVRFELTGIAEDQEVVVRMLDRVVHIGEALAELRR